jgi:HSP20 family protein
MKPPPSRCRAKPSTLRSLAPTLSLIEERQPIIDVFDEEDHLLILAQLPGMDRKDVKVKANDNTVTITAENATKKYLDTIRLPSHVMKGAVKFTYRNNILQAKLKKT